MMTLQYDGTILEMCPEQYKKTGQTITLGELLRQISQDQTQIDHGWLSSQELFQEMLAQSFPTKPLAFYSTSEMNDNKGNVSGSFNALTHTEAGTQGN